MKKDFFFSPTDMWSHLVHFSSPSKGSAALLAVFNPYKEKRQDISTRLMMILLANFCNQQLIVFVL